MTKIVHKNYINGEWKNSHSKKTYDIYNPANTREKIGSAQYSSDADVNEAIIAADKAAKIGVEHLHPKELIFYSKLIG